jgi:cytochrome c-type biogenesis protein CcmH
MRHPAARPGASSAPQPALASDGGGAWRAAAARPDLGAGGSSSQGLPPLAASARARLALASSPSRFAQSARPLRAKWSPLRARLRRCAGLLALLLGVFATPVAAVEPDEMLADPALEARARTISQELRCLVCQNQSIDDSNAALAKDLRLLVRERLRAGDNDAAVLAFVEARYGEFVLLRPKLNAHTLLLWLAPLLLLVATAVVVLRRTRMGGSRVQGLAPLSPTEQQRLDALLKRDRIERGL